VPGVSDGPAIESLNIGVATSAIPKETTVTKTNKPDLQQAGTAMRGADRAAREAVVLDKLEKIYAVDPAGFAELMQLLERLAAESAKEK
jgi:hypothetical protein